jgi:deoxyribonuclease-1-like protein
MLIQKRWPILFALFSGFAYLTNNYTIGGLENLRLQPKPANSTGYPGNSEFANPGAFANGQSSWQTNNSGIDLLNTAAQALNRGSAWGNNLGVGEKLAVIQDHMADKFANIADRSQYTIPSQLPSSNSPVTNLPSTTPIAAPPELSKSILSLGATSFNPSPIPSSLAAKSPVPTAANSPIMDKSPVLRIASFNLHSFSEGQLAKPQVAEALTAILRQFDLIALQGIQSERDDIMPILAERLNQVGRRFDYLIGPRVGRAGSFQQFAYLFDTAKVETDRYQLYTIEDPEQLMTFDPLVGWFRCKVAQTENAFTFSLVNLRVHRPAAATEQAFIPNLFYAISQDGRNEDDMIIVGDFGGNPSHIAKLNTQNVRFALRDLPTDLTGTSTLDGIIFPTQGTTEFTGRAGIFDFLRRYNLSLDQAREISPQMPMWAEFYTLEGAHPGRIAPVSPQAGR